MPQKKRGYISPLRERQSEQTREAIMEAATEQLADNGLVDFQVPKIARRAGVSIRTLYRYFPTKDALLEDLSRWLDARVGPPTPPASLEDLLRNALDTFPEFDENEALMRTQWATPKGLSVRKHGRSQRLASYREALREVTSNLPDEQVEDALALIAFLLSSRTWQVFKDDFDMDGRRSGQAVAHAVRVIVDDLRRCNRKAAPTAAAAQQRRSRKPKGAQ